MSAGARPAEAAPGTAGTRRVTEPVVRSNPVPVPCPARVAGAGQWYRAQPATAEEWRAHAAGVREAFASRDWLGALAPAIAASGAARARLDRVAAEGGVVVTSGQQAGLFGGPIYTWNKALTALALADAHERATGVPTAPVFWAATYDADFAEAAVTHVAVGPDVERLAMDPPAFAHRAMRDTPLGDVHALAAALRRAAGAGADPDVLATVEACYARDATVGGAFVALLRALLEPLGIAVLDAGHPAVRAAMRPLMERALGAAAAVDAAVAARDAALAEAGCTPTVSSVRGLTLVFGVAHAERRRVPLTRAAEAAAGALGELEPNVLLRPVAERAILPTVAYAAGPAERAYFAQSGAVADALGVALPVVVPRWSGVILEPHVRRILARYAVDPDELRDPHAVAGRLTRERVPEGVTAALARLRGGLDAALDALGREAPAAAGDPPLLGPRVLEGARRDLAHRVDRLERRVVAAEKRRSAALLRDLDTARAALVPLGQPQERVLNLVPLLARHGRALLHAMLDRAREHASALIPHPRAEPAAAPHAQRVDRA